MFVKDSLTKLSSLFPLAANAIGSASAMVDMVPRGPIAVDPKATYRTFTVVYGDLATGAISFLPITFTTDKLPTLTGTTPDVAYFSQPDVIAAVKKYGILIKELGGPILENNIPDGDPIWAAPEKMGTANAVFIYQPAPVVEGETTTTPPIEVLPIVIPDDSGLSAG